MTLVTTKILSFHTLTEVNSWMIWRQNYPKNGIFDQKIDQIMTINRPKIINPILFLIFLKRARLDGFGELLYAILSRRESVQIQVWPNCPSMTR